jgi:hypothetical protein
MQQLSCDELMQQLTAAAGDAQMTRHSYWIVELLRGLPAAEQISSDQVAVLLRLAAKRRQLWPHLNQQRAADQQHAACMLQLLRLPAAQQLSSKVVTELLALLLTWSKHRDVDECTAVFCRLPAAQQLTRKDVTQLLHTAAGASSEVCAVGLLCRLPAAQQINCFAVAALLRAAVQNHEQNHESGRDPFVGPVCGLPAAQQIRPDTVVELLTHAVERCTEHCVLHLCKLPAAQEVSSDDALQLLRLAVERSTADCVLQLCKLPAAQEISSDDVLQLLHSAAAEDRGSDAGTGPLCMLAGAHQLSAAVLGPLLMKAATQSDNLCVQHFAGLPGADQLDSNTVEQLLQTAVRRGDKWVVEAVCEMPAAQQLGPGPIVRLLREAGKWGDASHVTWLRALLPVNRYSIATVPEPPVIDKVGKPGQLPERRTREYDKDAAAVPLSLISFVWGRWP